MREQFSPEQIERMPESPLDLDIRDRIMLLHDVAGFFPLTKLELHEAVNLVTFQDTPGKAARHLNEVLIHQQKSTSDDPKKAVQSKTSEYASFAIQAQTDGIKLGRLSTVVQEIYNPKLLLADCLRDELLFNGVSQDDLDERILDTDGIRQLVRYIDMRRFFNSTPESKTRPPFERFPAYERTRGEAVDRHVVDAFSQSNLLSALEDHILEEVESYPVGMMRHRLSEAVQDAAGREYFWVQMLQQTKAHSIAKPIAERALAHLSLNQTRFIQGGHAQ